MFTMPVFSEDMTPKEQWDIVLKTVDTKMDEIAKKFPNSELVNTYVMEIKEAYKIMAQFDLFMNGMIAPNTFKITQIDEQNKNITRYANYYLTLHEGVLGEVFKEFENVIKHEKLSTVQSERLSD